MSSNELVDYDRWTVHKFGGTSVANADCMRKCVEILKPHTKIQRVAVVVSALGGKPKVTDLLLDLVHAAAAGRKDEINSTLLILKAKHKECVNDVLAKSPEVAKKILESIDSDIKDILDLLRAVELMKTAHEQILELVSGHGELWSATIMTEVMKQEGEPFIFVNARDVVIVSDNESIGTKVHYDESIRRLTDLLEKAEKDFLVSTFGKNLIEQFAPVKLPHLMITGYVATSIDGIATTLKRDGSDFSASIFGKLLNASEITIWTDVSGVYSADPRRVPDAQIIPEVTYTEAIELAYFGAKVIHPKTFIYLFFLIFSLKIYSIY
jgi:aspartokinase/homoserine dehydrogenase 1